MRVAVRAFSFAREIPMPNRSLPLFRLTPFHFSTTGTTPRLPALAGTAARRQLRRLRALVCANDAGDQAEARLVLALHRQLRPLARAE